ERGGHERKRRQRAGGGRKPDSPAKAFQSVVTDAGQSDQGEGIEHERHPPPFPAAKPLPDSVLDAGDAETKSARRQCVPSFRERNGNGQEKRVEENIRKCPDGVLMSLENGDLEQENGIRKKS